MNEDRKTNVLVLVVLVPGKSTLIKSITETNFVTGAGGKNRQ